MRTITRWGRWIADRWPHVQKGPLPGRPAGTTYVWRVFGIRPQFRMGIFDYTRIADTVRVQLFRWTIYMRGDPYAFGNPGGKLRNLAAPKSVTTIVLGVTLEAGKCQQ